MTKALGIALGLLALPVSAAVAATGEATAEGATPALCAPGASGVYPTFCGIPKTPTDVRKPTAFKAAVVDVRRAGKGVVRDTGPSNFGLPIGEADAFSRAARDEAAPPSEVSAAPLEQSEDVAAELRRRAAPPPPRPH